jgi:hypothetical protein
MEDTQFTLGNNRSPKGEEVKKAMALYTSQMTCENTTKQQQIFMRHWMLGVCCGSVVFFEVLP